jgi:hypothetical protein
MQRFRKGEIPELAYKLAIKKPIPIRCIQMEDAFTVETMEGNHLGKPGDYLMVGIEGEMYPCDREIFEKTYDIIPKYMKK